ncbi:MAG TPA: anthranilate phosphoribosyltransferase [Burkholderiales bacterium]|nr:anthranilate phosphoribosyltransferase [Burkholderiales bacterium]
MSHQAVLTRLIQHGDFSREEMLEIMRQIMTGAYTPVQIAGFLMAMRVKGEKPVEIAAAAELMREMATRINIKDPDHLVDTCGTGGDGAHTFNVSTASAIVAAAAGARVAKHGGRSVSSTCGSADVLEALGVAVNLSPEAVSRSIDVLGIGFMFAPNYHSAMKHAVTVRRELGVRTLFNLLGPLTNPAGAKRQVMGVFHVDLVPLLAHVLAELGSEHVLVVHGVDGMDEISISNETCIAELRGGRVTEYRISPEEFGMSRQSLTTIQVNSINDARQMLVDVLRGGAGAAGDIVRLNAGAAIYVSGVASTLSEGVIMADEVIRSGAAQIKLERLVNYSQELQSIDNDPLAEIS